MIDLLISPKFWMAVMFPALALAEAVLCWLLLAWVSPDEPHAVLWSALSGVACLVIWEVRMAVGLRRVARGGEL